MHLVTILAFVVLFWNAEGPGPWAIVGEQDVVWTLLIVVLQPPLLGLAAWLSARKAHRLLVERSDSPHLAQQFHHRAALWLRTATLAGFAVMVLLTRWTAWLDTGHPALQIFGDLVVLLPFFCGVIVVWIANYPLENELRAQTLGFAADGRVESAGAWRLRTYLDFHVRHYLLIVTVPMTAILFAANVTRGYGPVLREWSGWIWTPDVLFGATALCVFMLAPVMLTRIWHTAPLEAGPMRDRLEEICRRIGLRCREILVWNSDGMMINAAVMGVFARVRFVLLSDGLLATMDSRQIEAVFGHEAGHIKHHHIQYFLMFALVGWLLAAGLMEGLAGISTSADAPVALSPITIQVVVVALSIIYWGLAFGWLSRRFERQADLFGARCVTPAEAECRLPCSVHPGGDAIREGKGRVCATGAAVFASALNRVAMLNGIPHEERSWRHSSIGSRVRFLTSLAGDPRRGASFEALIRYVKRGMLGVVIIGSAICVYYWTVVSELAIQRLQAGGP